MRSVVLYGKGGIGKSTVASNLSMLLAERGQRVLHVGCDPKHDSTYTLVPEHPIPTIIERFLSGAPIARPEDVVRVGRRGIHCVEAGGPTPGTGCAGRGVMVATEVIRKLGLLRSGAYDVVLFDVVGDVVCGGFAAPLQEGLGKLVFIVVSDDIMSLYAGNNVSRVVVEYASNGVRLGGFVVNRLRRPAARAGIERFAARLGSRVVAVLPPCDRLREAERTRQPLVAIAPEDPLALGLAELCDRVLAAEEEDLAPPEPMSDEAFSDFVRAEL